MVLTWTETLYSVVPEYRLDEVFLHARRNRDSTYLLDVSELCSAWRQMREAQRYALPRIGQYDYRGTEVCPTCHNTGTKLTVRRDPIMQRDYTYGETCYHEPVTTQEVS